MSRTRILILCLICLLILPTVLQAQEDIYTVQRGDTIRRIADLFDISEEALLQFNGIIDPNRIRTGDVLRIPVGTVAPPDQYIVQPGDNLAWVAARYNVTVESLRDVNNLVPGVPLSVEQVLQLPPVGGPSIFQQSYIVQQGDDLRSIAESFGTTWQVLANFNNLVNPNLIFPGQEIIVPAAGTTAPTTPTTQPIPAPTQPPAPPAPQNQVYTIVAGDTFSQIAERFGVTLESIYALNNISPGDIFFPGDTIVIPPTGGPVVTNPPAPVVTAPTGAITGNSYVVQAGDNMFGIAARSGVNIYAIAQANGLLNLNHIFVGQRLAIPR